MLISHRYDFILTCFTTTPRRYRAIFHLLTGKRTISNLLAGLDYDLLPFFKFLPQLTDNDYQRSLDYLQNQGWLMLSPGTKLAKITSAGDLRKKSLQQAANYPNHVNYWQLGDAEQGLQMLELLVQTLSFAQYHQLQHMVPLASSTRTRFEIRRFWQHHRSFPEFKERLINELFTSLNQLSTPIFQQILVESWAGFNHPGKVTSDLGYQLHLTATAVGFYQRDAWSAWREILLRFNADFPLLNELFKTCSTGLSPHAQQTLAAFNQGASSFKGYCSKSRYKESTIREHLLEAAILGPNFNFEEPLLNVLIESAPDHYFSDTLRQIVLLKKRGGTRGC